MNRINGKSFDIRIMGFMIHCESFTLSIEDGGQVAQNEGVPNGWLEGDVKASGELVVDSANLMLLSAAAKAAGSWRDLPSFPIDAYASGMNDNTTELFHVHAHGCRLKLSDVLNVDKGSIDKTTHKINYDVTSPDFVWINGTPYLRNSEFNFF